MKILIAHDEAFNFTYRQNIDAMRAVGDVQLFSPLHDTRLPECDILYLPGGYPELFAHELSENRLIVGDIAAFAHAGGHILAECGGFIFLCQSIEDNMMCGVFPFQATMQNARLHLGYRQMSLGDTTFKGHEFHYSSLLPHEVPDCISAHKPQTNANGEPVDTLLYRYRNVIAGYTHWYWADNDFRKLWLLN